MNTFTETWYPSQVRSVQHGVGIRGERDPNNGMLTSGPETLPEKELAENRSRPDLEARLQPLDGLWYRERSADWSKVKVPFLSCGSWGGQGLHLRGNVEGFVRAASEQKWLEIHGLEHWTHFYTDYGLKLQKRFFDHFLKGEDNGWDEEAPVLLNIRYPGERFVHRSEHEWPLARTQWTKYFLNPADQALSTQQISNESEAKYAPLTSDGVTFWMEPFEQETEITGPLAAKVFMSSQTIDADLFLIVQLFDSDDEEVTFAGSVEPAAPIAQGWLRASHRKLDLELSTEYQPYHTHDEEQFLTPGEVRKLDPKLSLPYRPYHPHDEKQPLKPGEVVELDVEIWPTCIVVPPSHRLAFTIQGHDLERATVSGTLGTLGTFRGSGPFVHTNPWDRRPERVGGEVTIYGGGDKESYLLLPIIPAATDSGSDGEG
jgi:predicted acyl esterase